MMCRNPFMQGMRAFPCGQCMPCRVNRRRLWTHRIMLEAALRSDNAFVTLTYAEENLPAGMSLAPKDLQDWLKRFRKAIEPVRIRYFAVGEYGDLTQRPHYHLALFGWPSCSCSMQSRLSRKSYTCQFCSVVSSTWGKGMVSSDVLELHSAAYVAGYVAKKLTSKDDPRLRGRYPEFARMSRNPGIGVDMMHEVASTWLSHSALDQQTDVPVGLRHGAKQLPLGRHLRHKLREFVGRDPKAPQAVLDEMEKEVRSLYQDKLKDKDFVSIKTEVIKQGDVKARQLAFRETLKRKKGTI